MVEAMQYALLAPGKRLRPALALEAARTCGGTWEQAAPAALAVEMIHAYSLVHDDLPAMDDDDLRRGRPTCHRAFDEATAILCGDALQPLAFQVLASGMPMDVVPEACRVLAQAAGVESLVGGQVDDLAAERGWVPDLSDQAPEQQVEWMERIHRRKTGRLFLASLDLGCLAAGGNAQCRGDLKDYGESFGLAFQIADDLLDAEGSESSMGKRVGKDAERGKITFPTVIGKELSRKRADALSEQATAAISGYGHAAESLSALARWIVSRQT
ncbi:MAG TPA: farnesyl-diphosphate synthase [Planctomycetaceae bacterium]|nr:farnesyl-diphosphate synthase [Planctomycetaceae bacterium]